MKTERKGGRKEREIELKMREGGRFTRKQDEHTKGKRNQREPILSKYHLCLPLLTILFYRNDGKEVITKRRDVSVSSRDGLSG